MTMSQENVRVIRCRILIRMMGMRRYKWGLILIFIKITWTETKFKLDDVFNSIGLRK